MLCFLHVTYMMEEGLLKDLELVENELLVVRTQLDNLLQKQDNLLSKKAVLQSQLDSLVQSKEKAHLHSTDWENGHFEWSSDVLTLLHSKFKLSCLRFLQSSTINATLSGHDVILIMPTGGGKSLCYQLPSLLKPGVSLVISPLVSLMEDQLLSATRFGVGATLLNASSSREEVNRVYAAMIDTGNTSDMKLLYVTPEKLSKNKRFMSKLEKMYEVGRLSRIVIDEVHCVSQWGHDFRPDYKILGIMKRQFPSVPILGLTATATAKVLADCQSILSFGPCLTFRASYNRKNLFYEVRHKPTSQKAQIEEIATLIKTKFSKQSGIVYTLSRRNAEDVCAGLCGAGIAAGCYHTDRLPQDKTKTHRQWLEGSVQVIVATIAFGMGIDKPDVRFVIHHSLSKSMENYYQESGRAGRDGEPASCILYYRSADAFRQSAMVFTEHTGLANLSVMMRYCINETECRRELIASCFEEKWSQDDCLGACDVCVKFNSSDHNVESMIKYKVTSADVSKLVKDLVLIVQHNQEREQRLTGAKLVDIWRTRSPGVSRPGNVSSAYHLNTEFCERILVTALLKGVLKEEFHYTAYTTICYIGLGNKYELVKRGILQIEVSSLKDESECPITSATLETGRSVDEITKDCARSEEEPCTSKRMKLRQRPNLTLANTEDSDFEERTIPTQQVYAGDQSAPSWLKGRRGQTVSNRKGKKRKNCECDSVDLSEETQLGKRLPTATSVIVINESDSD